jgi:hypothetical protein
LETRVQFGNHRRNVGELLRGHLLQHVGGVIGEALLETSRGVNRQLDAIQTVASVERVRRPQVKECRDASIELSSYHIKRCAGPEV